MLRAYKICFTGVWHVQTKYLKLTCLWICASYRAEGTTQKSNIIFCYSHGHSLIRVLSSHWVSMNNIALISARPMMDQLTSWHYSKATLRSHTHNRTRGFSYAVSSCACGVANYVHWERRKLRISKVNYQNSIKNANQLYSLSTTTLSGQGRIPVVESGGATYLHSGHEGRVRS